MSDRATEVERIRQAYAERDAASAGHGSPWLQPAYRLYLQDLEWTLLRALADAGQDPSGRRVLEVGCGSGYYLNRFVDYGASHAAGIDLMAYRTDGALARNPNLEIVTGDASSMPWEDGSFDLVTQFTCLSSVLDDAVRAAIAREMWRVLTPGGAIVSYDIAPTPPALWPLRRLARLRHVSGPVTPTAHVSRAQLRRLFPDGDHRVRRAGVSLDLARVSGAGRVAGLLTTLPPLRTHLLAIVRKPG